MLTKEHQHHINKVDLLKNKLDKIYFHLIVQGFAASMISVFIPIFLLELGFGLSDVFIFLLIQWSSFSLLTPVSAKIISKMGLKEVIIFRTILFVGSLISLSLIGRVNIISEYYQFIAFFLGFSSCMYTLSITSLYANFMEKNKKGDETSKFISLPKLGVVFGPAAGGFISMYLGFTVLFIFASILLLCSVIPLSFIDHNLDHPKFDINVFKESFKKLRKFFIFLNFYGIKGLVMFMVLPVSIYLVGESLGSLGVVVSVISLINIVFSLWLGRKIDHVKPRTVLKVGATLTALLMVVLGVLSSSYLLIYFSFLTGFTGILIDLPFETKLYEQAQKSGNPLMFLVFKELSFLPGRVILLLVLIFLATGIKSSYYLGALSSFVFLFF